MEIQRIKHLRPGLTEAHLSGSAAPRVLVGHEKRRGRSVITRLVISGEALDAATLRAIPIGRIESILNVSESSERRRERLTRPDGSDPEGFSRRVAQAYAEVVATTAHPAKVLAEEAGVPVTTVHRWILEARRRGHLPPARKGRAG